MADGFVIQIEGKVEAINEISDFLKAIRNPEFRRKVAQIGSFPVVEAARKLAPESKAIHYRYSKGQKVATFYPGNLRRSIMDITQRRKSLQRKTTNAIIGPYILSRGSAATGVFKGARVDPYYAQFIYGSAKAFGSKVMVRALIETRGQVLDLMRKAVDGKVTLEKRKLTYWE